LEGESPASLQEGLAFRLEEDRCPLAGNKSGRFERLENRAPFCGQALNRRSLFNPLQERGDPAEFAALEKAEVKAVRSKTADPHGRTNPLEPRQHSLKSGLVEIFLFGEFAEELLYVDTLVDLLQGAVQG